MPAAESSPTIGRSAREAGIASVFALDPETTWIFAAFSEPGIWLARGLPSAERLRLLELEKLEVTGTFHPNSEGHCG